MRLQPELAIETGKRYSSRGVKRKVRDTPAQMFVPGEQVASKDSTIKKDTEFSIPEVATDIEERQL